MVELTALFFFLGRLWNAGVYYKILDLMEYGGDKYPKEPAVRQRQLRYVRAGKWIPPTSWQCMRARAARRRSRDGQEKVVSRSKKPSYG